MVNGFLTPLQVQEAYGPLALAGIFVRPVFGGDPKVRQEKRIYSSFYIYTQLTKRYFRYIMEYMKTREDFIRIIGDFVDEEKAEEIANRIFEEFDNCEILRCVCGVGEKFE